MNPRVAVPLMAALLQVLCVSAAHGQGQRRPLAPEHWSYALMRELDLASWPGAWPVRARPIQGVTVLEVLTAAEADDSTNALSAVARAWADRLAGEIGGNEEGVRLGLGVGLDRSDAKAIPTRGAFARAVADLSLSASVGAWADGVVWTDGEGGDLRSGGVAMSAGGVQLFLGRLQPAVRTGVNAILLNGGVGLDGVMVASRRPFEMPGPLARLGRFQAHLFVSPNHETPTVPDAWFTSYGVGWSPVPSLSFGVARTIRFGGEGLAPFTFSNLWNMLAFGGGDSDFDDSQGELSVRARIRLGGLRLGVYGAVGFEDLKAIKEDPAVSAGFSVPVATRSGLLSLGYEFLGIGPRGIWCGCDAVSHSWYTQREYGPYTADGELLGSALGGYGAGHYLSLGYWSTPYPLFVRGRLFLEDRSEENLLRERWPDQRTGVRVDMGIGPWRGLRATVGLITTSTELGPEHGLEMTLQALDLTGAFGRR